MEYIDHPIEFINLHFFKPITAFNSPMSSTSIFENCKPDFEGRQELDYHFLKGLYVNMGGQFALASTSEAKPYNSSYYSALTVTRRFEGRRFGFYLPLNYNASRK